MRSPLGRGLGTRLAALVLVPAIAFLMVGGLAISRSDRQADRAAELEEHVETLAALMQLDFAASDEQFPAQVTQQAESFGVTLDRATELLGFDPVERMSEARQRVDSLMAVIPEHVGVDAAREPIDRARLLADTTGDADAMRQAYNRVEELLRGLIEVEIAHTQALLGDAAVPPRTLAAVEQLFSVHTIVEQVEREVPLAFEVMLSLFTEESSGDPRGDLARVVGWYGVEAAELSSHLTGSTLDAWRSLRSDPGVRDFESGVEDLLAGEAFTTADLSQLAELAIDGFAREELHVGVFEAAAEEASIQAADVSRDVRRGAQLQLFVLGATLLVTLALVIVVARSISTPLDTLAEAARSLTAGDLVAGSRSGSGGPTQVAVVRSAYDDLVAQVRTFDAQADALAHNRLDDPVLDVALPGRLGDSLRMSVNHLSRTMADRERLHGELLHQATHDSLTGLANRAAAQFSLDSAVGRARRSGGMVAVLFIDLDDFKRMNDTYGHAAGDAVLTEVARRLRATVRSDSVVARLGGDEFLVIVEGESIPDVLALGERIVTELDVPIDVTSVPVRCGASVGVALLSDPDESAEDLLRSADIATYRAKSAGRGRVELFDDALRREIDEMTRLEAEIADALRTGQLTYALQPVWHANPRRIVGFEALVRWTRTDGTTVSPADFIPVAEMSDLVVAIDNHVMRLAAVEALTWAPDIHLSVNISGRHLLERRVIDDVASVLEDTGLDPSRLVLEITETVLVSDTTLAYEHLAALRTLGVRIAIDDFGSGYTSFAHLRQMPVDVLKIDRLFISELGGTGDASLVHVVIEAAHGLGLSVVAEGVETDEQLAVLEALNCEEVQGFLLGRPVPPAEATSLVPPAERQPSTI